MSEDEKMMEAPGTGEEGEAAVRTDFQTLCAELNMDQVSSLLPVFNKPTNL
jgi:hypothetical protein